MKTSSVDRLIRHFRLCASLRIVLFVEKLRDKKLFDLERPVHAFDIQVREDLDLILFEDAVLYLS